MSSTAETRPAVSTVNAHTTEAPGLGRSILTCGIAAFAIVFACVAGGLSIGGSEHSTALGLGAFAAIWGGGGFGAMVGGVLHATRMEEQELAAVEKPVAVS